ncbi:beta-lactamase family protein [bacterium]|nr:beta-lactamase family protein [bacterium]
MKKIHSIIGGEVAPGFEEVKKEFIKNFTKRGELGATCSVYYQGQKVVDLWGGYRDWKSRLPWKRDTLVMVFSSTKGLAAMTLAVAHSYGWIDYDAPVAKYWPEFGQEGKKEITIRQLLSHQAGLCALEAPVYVEEMKNLDGVAEKLSRQKPLWKPGTKHGYHAATLGMYMNELIRRVDPQNRSLGQFFQEEIAQPLNLEFYIGLPEEVPDDRIADNKMVVSPRAVFRIPLKMTLRFLNPRAFLYSAFRIPRGYHPHKRESRSIELPSGNGIGQVRSMARAYGEFATMGAKLKIRKETMEELMSLSITPAQGALDEVLGIPSYYSLGFTKPGPNVSFGTSRSAFGAPGAGGSFAFADPDKGIGYAYAMSKMNYNLKNDPREKSLRKALYRCLH